ncbi:MAG TPA: redoxin family protein, partial [Saprospiraceae bacterium]|nr:redoxin family protein [Saprospiraceae bacterium]
MKRILLLLAFSIAGWTVVHAQLPSGSTAPDFTVTDLDGNTYNLYTLLDEGKTVYLDFFATWCGPCWNYHNTHAFRDLWDTYGPPGTNEAMVFSIEGDASTNTACLYG